MSRILKSALARAKSQAVKRDALLGSDWKRIKRWKWFPEAITDELRLNAGVRFRDILNYGIIAAERGKFGDYLTASQCFITLHATSVVTRLYLDMVVDEFPSDAQYLRLTNDWDDWFPQCVPLRLGHDSDVITTSDVRRYIALRLKDNDSSKYLEAAQCAALLHFLGYPGILAVIDAVPKEYTECHDIK